MKEEKQGKNLKESPLPVCVSLHGWGIRTIPACRWAVWPLNFGYRIKVPAGHLLAEMLNGADAAEETEAARRVRLQTARLIRRY